jgi:hypothetical protein
VHHELNLDFVGRFIFVERGHGDLTVLAVNLPPSTKGDRHEPLLIVSEPKAEWSISGCLFDIPIHGGFNWQSGPALAERGMVEIHAP